MFISLPVVVADNLNLSTYAPMFILPCYAYGWMCMYLHICMRIENASGNKIKYIHKGSIFSIILWEVVKCGLRMQFLESHFVSMKMKQNALLVAMRWGNKVGTLLFYQFRNLNKLADLGLVQSHLNCSISTQNLDSDVAKHSIRKPMRNIFV